MIYCIGDSFTYGDELTNRDESAWPALVANSFNKLVTNLGRKGAGNTRIVKRIIDTAFKDDAELILVAWTHYNRFEFFFNKPFDTWPGRTFRGATDMQAALTKALTIEHSSAFDLWAYRKWLREIILTQNLLEQQKKKYLMMVTWHEWGPIAGTEDLWGKIDFSKFLGNPNSSIHTPDYETFCHWFLDAPKGPRQHPLELGHKRIADKINEHIRHLGWLS